MFQPLMNKDFFTKTDYMFTYQRMKKPRSKLENDTDGQNRECRASEKHTFHMVGIHVILIFSVNDCVWADQYPGFCTR